MNQRIAELAGRVLAGQVLSREEALVLGGTTGAELFDLFYWANVIRLRLAGSAIATCGILASKVGSCEQDCKFCSQSAHYQTHVTDSVLDTQAIVAAAHTAATQGATNFALVNSGVGPSDEEIEQFGQAMQRISREVPVNLCASFGVLTDAQARWLAALGVRRYNHNLQTSRRFFPRICTTQSYDQRVETIRSLHRAGIGPCCGGLFGMGETWEDRIDLALTLRELQVDTVPINFLIPIPGTPLEGQSQLCAMECLKIIAVYRLLLPRQTIVICGGREVHLRDLQSWIFLAGAGGMMIGNYLTTCGRTAAQDMRMLADLGLSALSPAASSSPAEALREQMARYVQTPHA